ncbi:MAG TPA: maleylpyruvate isomerase N-terminal domain-containing protein [Thermomicrobiales bacterium]
MADTETREAQRTALATAIARFAEAVERQPDELFLLSVADRTPRDIVAHLIGWNRAAVVASGELRHGQLPACLTDPGPNFSRINALAMAQYASRDKGALLDQLRASAADYDAMLRDLPEAEWDEHHGIVLGDWPVSNGNLVAALIHDFTHHRGEIECWPAPFAG